MSKWFNTGLIILVGKYLTHTYIAITSSHINDIKHYPDNKKLISTNTDMNYYPANNNFIISTNTEIKC